MSTPSDIFIPKPVRFDRAVGVVLASAAGDALGAPYEFGPPLVTEHPLAMDGGGQTAWAPGEWTDDTQMALAILGPLAAGPASPGPLLSAVELGFRAWFKSGPADVGIQTRAVLGALGPLADRAARYAAQRPGNSAGNGSLMRTGPVALAHPEDPAAIAELAANLSALTHTDPDCVDACVLWSVAIDDAIHHAPPSNEAWDFAGSLRRATAWVPAERRDRWTALIDEADRADPLGFPKNGWVIRAFQAALAAITVTPVPAAPFAGAHLHRAIEAAVRVGDDADTVAAIAGSLLGARWGATAVPLAWRAALNGKRIYGEPTLTDADLDRLAWLAFNGGQPDSNDWPAVPSMLPHYRQTWDRPPLLVELDGVAFGNVHAIQLAVDAGADTVISLCRMGAHDVPKDIDHHTLGLLDSEAEENPNLVLLLADLVDTIAGYVQAGRNVFVHCVQAQNRTPTAAAAWLVRHGGVTPDDALTRVAREINEPKRFFAEAVRSLA